MKRFLYITLVFFNFTLSAQETINTMFYNLLEFPEALPGGRTEILKSIVAEFEPDIFMVCELQNEAGADAILNQSLNSEETVYARAPFVANQSGEQNLQQLVYFKTEKFSLEASEVISTQVRDINRYLLKMKTVNQESNPVYINLYVAHLKSSQGSTNQNLRLGMVTEFTNHLETLDPDSFVIFSGDFNLYTASEPAYQELLDPSNAIIMIDPINTPGSWHNNDTFQSVHTQSTRISAPYGAGAGGGLDDRFDFITMSQNMLNHPNLHYLTDTYKAFGNNGNCYNLNISDESCVGEFSQELRNNLYSMSDHLPVIMQLETNESFLLNSSENTSIPTIYLNKTLVRNMVQVIIPDELRANTNLFIFNSLGQKIMSIPTKNQKNITFEVSFLPSGLYYIKAEMPNAPILKFIKQ